MRRLFHLLLALVPLTAQGLPVEVDLHDAVVVTVEAELQKGGRRSLRMLLDTGASHCLVDIPQAEGLAAGWSKREEISGFAGRTRMVLTRAMKHWACGSAEQESVLTQVMDLSGLNRWLDRPVDGVLGATFLAGRTFTLDLERRSLTWDGPSQVGSTFPLSFKPHDGRPWISLRVGSEMLQALVDTGCSVALVIPERTQGTYHIEACELASGLDGVRRVRQTRAAIQALGGARRGQLCLQAGGLAVLGRPFLFAGPTTFDFKRGTLTLPLRTTQVLPRRPAPLLARTLPITWNRESLEPSLEVCDLPSCHRWAAAGFKAKDAVLAVEGIPHLSLDALDIALGEGRILTWHVRRGKQRLTLQNPNEDPRLVPEDEEAAPR